ncbi:hypothetical protein E4P48_00665 [Porphyromonas levii]|uniref:Uncharacterized protein n=1 Tax=Porphyromonas levii TaxID=28114 RepID=A0A4Y8WQZ3_9PORP|nr:hypothetical protein E4P47_02030 [Porphyromonas levii]TFH97800.1 hypothetical protein E4P48_00665 [Porphyromonas levii]
MRWMPWLFLWCML